MNSIISSIFRRFYSHLQLKMSYPATYGNCERIAKFIRKKISIVPKVGIVCGSGLGGLAEAVKDPVELPYSTIQNFPHSTVAGHKGTFVFGYISGVPSVVMQGRFHPYEGYTNDQIAIPIRVLKLLGVEYLLLSNAAGGLNRSLRVGDFVVLNDHLNLPGFALMNVLVGKNEDRFGPRFPSLNDAYDKDLRKMFHQIMNEENLSDLVHEGVYAISGGPTYETPAEARAIQMLGADVVGMSTVPEVIIARHCNMKVMAISLVTNMVVMDINSQDKPNHEEVLAIGRERAGKLQTAFIKLIKRLN